MKVRREEQRDQTDIFFPKEKQKMDHHCAGTGTYARWRFCGSSDSGGMQGGPGGGMDFGGFFGFGQEEESEAVTLTSEDCDDLATFVSRNLCNYDLLFHYSIGGGRQYDLCFLLHHCRCGGQLCCHQ